MNDLRFRRKQSKTKLTNFFFVFSLQLKWNEAEMYASLLCEHSKWSRTIYTYQKAAIMMMKDKKYLTLDDLENISNLMR